MKIRNGFVSNSSSSSFLIDATKTSVKEVAIEMIEQLYDTYIKNYEDEKENYVKQKSLMIERVENRKLNDNIGIFIPASDDIEIVKVDDNVIYVDATYHVEWDLENIIYDKDSDDYYGKIDNTKWYMPDIDNKIIAPFPCDYDTTIQKKYGTSWLYRCENKECDNQSRYLIYENQVFCPNCMHDPNGKKVAFRKDKIKRLLDEK